MRSRFSMTDLVVTSAVVSLAVCLGVLYFLGLFPARPMGQGAMPDQLYNKILETGHLRAAYAVGAPLWAVDPTSGKKTGIFYEIVEASAAKLGLKVDWTEEVGYGEMGTGLAAHRYDIVGSGVWVNAARAREADFTTPLFYDTVWAFARRGETRFADLAALNSESVTLATRDGELGASIAAADDPKAKTLALPQNADFAQLPLNVQNGKADAVFLAAGVAFTYPAVRAGELVAVGGRPARLFGNALMLPRGEPSLRQALNHALAELQNEGILDAILKKYEPSPGLFLRPAVPFGGK